MHRTLATLRPAAGAHGRTEVHDGLGIVGDTCIGGVIVRQLPKGSFNVAPAGPARDPVHAGQDAFDIAIQDRMALLKGKRQYGAGSGGADTGQGVHLLEFVWEAACVVRHDLSRGAV